MSNTALDALIECQHELLAAFDHGDVSAIERATSNLALAVNAAKGVDAWRDQQIVKSKLDLALRQTAAAHTRVNFLADWNCQKIEKLAALRGKTATVTYKNPAISGLFHPS